MNAAMKFALLNAAAALLIAVGLIYVVEGENFRFLLIVAPLAAWITGLVTWRVLVSPGRRPSSARVVFAGLLTGSVSHYVAILLISIGMNLCFQVSSGCAGSLGEPPATLFEMLKWGWGYVFFSMMLVGWISVPASIAIGFWVAKSTVKPVKS